jgi:Glu-tRNA(Gln) amidotransferase subunit E-like FAD-binding protein
MKNLLITAAVALIIGFGLGSYLCPRVETQTVEVEKEVIRRDVVTEIVEVIRPDGSKEVKTIVVDKSKEQKDSKSTVTVVAAKNYIGSVSAATRSIKFDEIVYTASIQKRIMGPFFLGGSASTDKQYGLIISMEF